LPIHFVGDGALLQHHDDVARLLRERGDMKIDLAIATDPRLCQIDRIH
jgi:hypothetical protein